MSTTRQLRGLLVLLTVLVAMVVAAGAAAARPTLASGTVGNTSATFNSTRMVGGDLIADVSGTRAYTGTFRGTSVLRGILIVHPDASAFFVDIETFTGTVNGVPGTVTFLLTGSNDAALEVHSTSTILGATGELAGLHGVLHEVGTVVLPNGPVGTYSGYIR